MRALASVLWIGMIGLGLSNQPDVPGPVRATAANLWPRRAMAARDTTGGTVRGTVVDSLSGLPLGGALVQLVDTSASDGFTASVLSDAGGQYRLTGVPSGIYRIGFFHPLLDSLSVQPRTHVVRVTSGRTIDQPLFTPSASLLRAALCSGSPDGIGGGVVVGTVRQAQSRRPLGNVTVYGEWLEFSIGTGGLTRTPVRRTARTTREGWFALCNVPAAGGLLLSARSGQDSTERFELTMPPEGVLRQSLMLADDETTVRLQGRIRRLGDGRVVAGAMITIPGIASTRANDEGEWWLPPVPAGTRIIEYRAVGFYPTREVVHIDSAAGRQDVTLATMQSVLDTVKVVARFDRYRTMTEFAERRQSGAGRYLTAEDIRLRVPLFTSDLFRAFPGLFVDTGQFGEPVLTMRGIFSSRCTPAIFINGFEMLGFDAIDLDAVVKPDDILGVEVYSEASAPIQFKGGMRPCGSLVLWTR